MHADEERKPNSIGNNYRINPGAANPTEHFPRRKPLRRRSWLRILGPVTGLALLGTLALIVVGSARGL